MPYSIRPLPTPLDVRRAVFAVFIRADGGPLTIAEVISRTKSESGLDLQALPGPSPHQRISDMMRHQVRYGRAKAVERGVYALDTTAFSRSTIWRCLHWRSLAERRRSPERYIARYRGEPWEPVTAR